MLLFFTAVCLALAGADFENATEFLETTANITVMGNGSVDLERIVQPSQLFEQAQSLTTNLSVNFRSEKLKPIREFRPSPQLETYYEYNKFPVVPAFPEAKRFSSQVLGEGPTRPWVGKVLSERTTETALPWMSKVRFPTPPPVTSKDYPYPFVINHPVASTEIPIQYGPPNLDFPVQKIPDAFTFPTYGGSSMYGGLQYGSIDKFERGPVAIKGPVSEASGFGLEGRPVGDVRGFPWKKIVKFLTAAIPIGILISALTPSVINVSSVNVTQKNRARSRENESSTLISSLNFIEDLRSRGCEERILCELMISVGSSFDAEKNAENVLEVFAQQQNMRKKRDELKRIMKSVKKNNCDEFACRLESRKKRKSN